MRESSEPLIAVELLGHSPQGQTIPLYLRCSGKGASQIYQCKIASRRTNLHPIELATEFVGNRMATRIGLAAAEPRVVHLSNEVQAAIEARYAFGVTDPLAVGMRWQESLIPFIPRVHRNRIRPEDAAKLVALDILLANGDRTDLNPNLAWRGSELFVFDFEHCLELPGLETRAICQAHRDLLQNLLASHVLAHRFPDLREAVLGHLDASSRWLETEVPPVWTSNFGSRSRYLEYLKAEPSQLRTAIGAMDL